MHLSGLCVYLLVPSSNLLLQLNKMESFSEKSSLLFDLFVYIWSKYVPLSLCFMLVYLSNKG